jgi:hypothetical protein
MQPGYPQQPVQPPAIDNNMTMSIVSIFFFWPLAIPAIINASKVNPSLMIGDFGTAQNAQAESKKWSKLAIIIGACTWVLCCGIWVAVAVLGSAATNA